jgi:hypothetical protein
MPEGVEKELLIMNRGWIDEFDISNLWTGCDPVQHDFYLGARGDLNSSI